MPRDVDIVVDGCSTEQLRYLFNDLPHRTTRFGGLRLDHGITVDIWSLQDTWAFKNLLFAPSFTELPKTTFLNVEAVVAGLHDRRRPILSAGFFEGIEEEILNINLEHNPYPALCVIRALTLAAELRFSLSKQLASYIVDHAHVFPVDALMEAQRSHYGIDRYDSETVTTWIRAISNQLERGESRIDLVDRQRELWPGTIGDRTPSRPPVKRTRRSPEPLVLQEDLPF
jgi:hypothetical protein